MIVILRSLAPWMTSTHMHNMYRRLGLCIRHSAKLQYVIDAHRKTPLQLTETAPYTCSHENYDRRFVDLRPNPFQPDTQSHPGQQLITADRSSSRSDGRMDGEGMMKRRASGNLLPRHPPPF